MVRTPDALKFIDAVSMEYTSVINGQDRKLESAMRRLRYSLVVTAALIGLILLSAVACGGGGEGDGGATPIATAVTQDVDLADALLTFIELPSGWTTTGQTVEWKLDEPPEGCDVAGLEVQPVQEAGTTYTEMDTGASVTHLIAIFPEGGAEEMMAFGKDLIETCPESTFDVDGSVGSYHQAPMSFPDVGDETVAARSSVEEPDGVETEFARVAIRRGDAVLYMDIPIDSAEDFARRAYAKLESVLEG